MEKSKNSQSFGELFRKALPGNKVLVIENETSFDIERIKRNELNEYERIERGACSVRPKRKHASNYTPPKKRHRK